MSQFLTTTEKKAKSVDEAIKLGLLELGISEQDADIEIIDEGTKGFLGLGAKEACVRVSIKDLSIFTAKKFLNDVFSAMDLEVNIETEKTEDGFNINLSGDNMGIVIGKRGDTLDSLQYLTSLVINRDNEDYKKISIDTENYREKRSDALLQLSQRLESKVSKSGKKYTLEPMNPYERRVIHAALQNSETVTTYSIGDDPYRKVVIAPKVEKKTQYKKNVTKKANKQKETSVSYKKSSVNDTHRTTINKVSSFEEYLNAQNEE